jgi:peptidyl-prolyl cis-trans isomerase C
MLNKKIIKLICCLLLSSGSLVYGEESVSAVDSDPSISFFALVNYVPIPDSLLELNVKNAVSQGEEDTPELRTNLKQELINRELLSQDAQRQQLDKKVDLPTQYLQLKQTLLLQALVQDYLSLNPINSTMTT